jgi:hypothetical protein
MRRSAGILTVMSLLAVAPLRAQLSPGPLARPHAALEGTRQCLTCHPVGRKDAMDGACLACHREIAWLQSEGRGLHAREGKARCASCHPDHAGRDFALVAWAGDSLERFGHARAGWELTGTHRATACDDCHAAAFRKGEAARRSPLGGTQGRWTGLERSCGSCHDDVHRARFKGECTACHDTRDWAPAQEFDHSRAGYPLTGQHLDLACEKCHAPRPADLRQGPSHLDPGFPRLRFSECSSCHRDPHQGRLGAVCADCHLTTGFLIRKTGAFDHARARYPLAGRHASVSCRSCHERGGRRTNPRFGACADCHAPAHRAAFTVDVRVADCESCHEVAGFKPSSFTAAKHGAGRCGDCHEAAHGTQLAARPRGEDCNACHGVGEWRQSVYPITEHAQAGLPLEGRHAAIPCGSCHGADRPGLPSLAGQTGDGRARVRFRTSERSCTACHVDPHAARYGATCDRCHQARAWRPAAVDTARHAELGFALAGAHRATPCVACHEELTRAPVGAALLRGSIPPAPLRSWGKARVCGDCHRDPHQDQFAPRACDVCHTEELFAGAGRFDHGRTSFTLAGAHARVACSGCHVSRGPSRPVIYRDTPATCERCHTAGATPPPVRRPTS